ncbi:MAG: tryptophan synthase subunit alpha [Pseudomonadales bacterium]
MSRLSETFRRLADSHRKALVPYIVAGDPSLAATVPAMRALVAAGADIIELGVPFSDPEAEGPSIQAACERALSQGTNVSHVLGMVAEFRHGDQSTPVVLMGYLNNIERMGYSAFADRAHEAGVDGILMVNLPPEEADALRRELERVGIALIFLVAPTTTHERAELIARKASGFIYYVSLKGVTGASHLVVEDVLRRVEPLRAMSDLPVLVGFGIKEARSAADIAKVADGVVVGSVLVDIMGSHRDSEESIAPALEACLGAMRAAMDANHEQ